MADGGTPEHFVQVAAHELAMRKDIAMLDEVRSALPYSALSDELFDRVLGFIRDGKQSDTTVTVGDRDRINRKT